MRMREKYGDGLLPLTVFGRKYGVTVAFVHTLIRLELLPSVLIGKRLYVYEPAAPALLKTVYKERNGA